MRHIKEILRLKQQNGLSVREVAASCGLPASTVGDYVRRAEVAGLVWPLPEAMTEDELRERLLGNSVPVRPEPAKPLPDWSEVHAQLRRKGVTLRLLWEEYLQAHPDGYQYSRFCELYQAWAQTLEPVLRQVHLPGEKMFVDWAGQKIPIHHPDGTVSEASLFVAVLGGSNKTYAEAFENEQIDSWITAHVHAFEFYGGVSRALVPDNPKTAVLQADRYEPRLHRSYQEMAQHFGTVILPARPRRPRDKSKAESGVQIAERRILAVLRDCRFFGVAEANQTLRPCLDKINEQPFQKLDGSRNSWFEAQEKAALLPLPAQRFELATWSQAKVNIDYHVVVKEHFYSVPYSLIHRRVDVRLSATTVEIFYQHQRVAAHARSAQRAGATTLAEHRPKSHQRYLQWPPSRMVEWARKIGPQCAQVVEQILAHKPHPEQGFRSTMGLIRLGKAVGAARLEAACQRALRAGTCSYRSLKSILDHRLDQQPEEPEWPLPSPSHPNVRGQQYYAPEPPTE